MPEDQSPWDDETIERMLGKTVLIGLTIVGTEGTTLEQMFGTVVAADPKAGFTIALEGSRAGDNYYLPPQPDAFFEARPGEYRLRKTGEIVVNPDYTTKWTINLTE